MQGQLPGHAWHEGDFAKSESVAAGAKRFAAERGMRHADPSTFAGVRAKPGNLMDFGTAVKNQQSAPAHMSPQLHASYQALNAGIADQYDHLTRSTASGGMGISIENTKEDPYENVQQARDDIHANNRMKVYATDPNDTPHPAMTADQNNKFRAVHDVFGHVGIGRNTTRHGEEAAFLAHRQMFPKAAHEALASETRGQNAGLILTGNFLENKPYVLPAGAEGVTGQARKKRAPKAPKQEGLPLH